MPLINVCRLVVRTRQESGHDSLNTNPARYIISRNLRRQRDHARIARFNQSSGVIWRIAAGHGSNVQSLAVDRGKEVAEPNRVFDRQIQQPVSDHRVNRHRNGMSPFVSNAILLSDFPALVASSMPLPHPG
jgi:hypothetical protein